MPKPGYDALYQRFDSPLMQQIRREAYGEDVGQHSWVTAAELRADAVRLRLGPGKRLLDLGCGPGGPLAFLVELTGCCAVGVDLSEAALEAGRARARSRGLEASIELRATDLDAPLPFADRAFDAVISLDVVLHLADRARAFREVARVLAPGGAFLFTDAGVLEGAIGDEERRLRAPHGHTALCPPGTDERALEQAGLSLAEREDRTASLIENASGRLAARAVHRAALEAAEGAEELERQQRYLETVIALARRRAVTRSMFLARSQPPR